MAERDKIIKINLNGDERNWNTFIEKVFNAVINRNEELVVKGSNYAYTFNYDPDEIEICNNKIIGVIPNQLKSMTLTKDSYNEGDKSDKDIIDSLFNSIQSES